MKLMSQPQKKTDHSESFSHYKALVKKAGQIYQRCSSHSHQDEDQVALLFSAKFHAEQALAIASDTQLFNLLARIHLDLGQINEAESYINQALALKPNNAPLLYSAGHIFLASGQLKKAEDLFQRSVKISRTATKAESSLAYTYLALGKTVEAFQLYRELIKTNSDDPFIKSKLFESAAHMSADFYSDELEHDLLRYLSFEQVDYSQLHSLVASLLWHKFQFTDNATPLTFDQLSSDELFLTSLNKFFFQQPIFERMLISMRQSLLLDAAQHMSLKEEYLPFAQALAMQAYLNEYVWPITEQEQQVLNGLEDLLTDVCQHDWQPSDVSIVVLLLAAYQPINQSKVKTLLSKKSIDQWPELLQPLMEKVLFEPEQERSISQHLPYWGTISNKTSRKVAEQYNENPYPRWTDLGVNTISNYLETVQNHYPNATLPKVAHGEKLRILVAGTGTGRQAIRLAKYFHNIEVLAIDISATALSYAKRKAEEMNIENIQFMQADILELGSLPMKFHVVECSGVLHHMKYPEQGITVLKSLLVENGLFKMALYSREARLNIIKLRDIITKANLSSARDIRLFRQALLLEKIPGEWQDILQSPDFYSLSNCRDLLFHCQEHQYDLIEIDSILKSHDLNFLGLLTDQHKEFLYREMFDQKFSRRNVSNWHQLEKENPDMFSEMYQFYCQ